MNIFQIVQSVLVYICTAGFMAALGYVAALSKRVTILEQKMEFTSKGQDEVSIQVKEILKVVTDINTRITKLEAKIERND